MSKAKILRDALKQVAPKALEPVEIFYDKRKGAGGGHRYKLWMTGGINYRQAFKLKEILDQQLVGEYVEYVDTVVKSSRGWGGNSVAIYTRSR